jgi:hypothetical protein
MYYIETSDEPADSRLERGKRIGALLQHPKCGFQTTPCHTPSLVGLFVSSGRDGGC